MGCLFGDVLRRRRHANANLQQPSARMRRQRVFRPVHAGLHRRNTRGRRLVRLEPVLRQRLQHRRHANANLHQPGPGVRRPGLRGRFVASLQRRRCEQRRMGDRRLEPVDSLRRVHLHAEQSPQRHLLAPRVRRCPLRPGDQARSDRDAGLPEPRLADRCLAPRALQRDRLWRGRHPDLDADRLLSMHQRLHRHQAGFVENAGLYGERAKGWRVACQRVGIVELQRYIMHVQQDAARYLHSARLWREPMRPGH